MTPGSGTVVDARARLSIWLRDGRARKKLSIDDVARITKIQSRILEKLENGQLDGLPAEVFVKGFVKSFARCVGLDQGEALDRYTQCRTQQPVARALVETMSELAPITARMVRPIEVVEVVEVVEVAPPVEVVTVDEPVVEAKAEPVIEAAAVEAVAVEAVAVDAPKKKRTRKKAVAADGTPKAPRTRKKKATPVEAVVESAATPVDAIDVEPSTTIEILVDEPSLPVSTIDVGAFDAAEAFDAVDATVTAEGSGPMHGTWRPTMPPLTTTSSVPWRRPTLPAPSVPSLVIDDADPDRAEREQDERAAALRVSFLPPILLDREDRSGRQGGLTLAVIILLIAATLTLSYLMRRPNVSGSGVTMNDVPATLA